jgi:hypothetical protein
LGLVRFKVMVNTEFQINTTTNGDQQSPRISKLSGGGFVVIWESSGQDGSDYNIYAQRYGSNGIAIGTEFRVNTQTSSSQQFPSITTLADGGFVVIWESSGISGQRYDNTGIAVGDEFEVSTGYSPSIAALNNGGFFVIWQSSGDGSYDGIFGQRFDAFGAEEGSQFRINSNTEYMQQNPAVTTLANGDVVATWESSHPWDGTHFTIMSQRYDSNGQSKIGYEIDYPYDSHISSSNPSVLALNDNDYVVAWQSNHIYAKLNNTSSAFKVNTFSSHQQSNPTITTLNDGGFVITWQSEKQDGYGYGIYAQRYDNSGTTVGSEFQVNTYAITNQSSPSSVALDDGGFVITWQSENQDGSGYGVYGQRYDAQSNSIELITSFAPTEIQLNAFNITENVSGAVVGTLSVIDPDVDSYSIHNSTQPLSENIIPSAKAIVGGEFQVNTYTSGAQQDPSITALNDGGFVATWSSDSQDGDGSGIYGQRYDSVGAKAGGEFQVNTYTNSTQNGPSITALNDGGFVATWKSWDQDGSGDGIYGQRYDSAGAKAGAEFQVNTYTSGNQSFQSITGLNDGGFVVTWDSDGQDGDLDGVFGQRYDSAGAKAGAEFQVNTYTNSAQFGSSITALNDGGFVATWWSFGQDGDHYGVYGQRYDSAGAKAGAEFQVNTYTNSAQNGPSITGLNDGGFVATWKSDGQDGSGNGIYGQRYDSAGATVGAEFLVNTTTYSDQMYPSITALNDGGFVATWWSFGQDGDHYGVYGQRYDSAGAKAGAEFQVNTYTSDSQYFPSITALNDGGFVVTWQSVGQDGDHYGIYGQRYDSAGQAVTAAAVTGVSTLDFNSLNLVEGDRITLTIAGGTRVQEIINSDGLDVLLTSMASDVAAQTTLFSSASASNGVLTLYGLTDGTALPEVTAALESHDTVFTGTDAQTHHSLDLSGTDAGAFEIVDGQLKLKDTVSADYEAKSSYTVTVTATDSGGLTYSDDFTVSVQDENESPTAITLSNSLVDENIAGAIVGSLSTTDIDSGDSHTYALSGSDKDSFEIVGGTLKLKEGFSADFETISTYDLLITSTDSKGLAYTEAFFIEVNDCGTKVISVNNKLLDNLTMNLFDQGVDLNQSVGITDGEIEVDQTINFDAIKLSNANAYTSDLNIRDVMGVLKHIVNISSLEGQAFHAGDVNNDDLIDIRDVMAILKDIVNIEKIDTFDLIDSSGDRVDQIEDGNPATLPEWTLIANGDVNQSGSFADDHIVQVGTSDISTEPSVV